MLRRLILGLFALCYASAALAIFPKPPDVPDYVAVAPLYKTDGTVNTVVDPAVTPPPAYSYELTNIPTPSDTGRISVGHSYGPTSPYCVIIGDGGTCNEYKFRTSVDCGYILPDDPQRNFGLPGTSHLHEFCGAGSANANSTYKTLRQHALDSMAAGTDVNGTAYWRPATVVLNPYSNGKNYAILDNDWTVYYKGVPGVKEAHWPVGFRFVTGFEMDAASPTYGAGGQYAWLQTILDAANAVQGYTRYRLVNPNTGRAATQVDYSCGGATPTIVNYYKNPDGSDPYGGTCASGATFFAEVDGANCWDGKNLWSPGGYKHLIPGVYDSVVSKFACPYNYYQVPNLRLELPMTQYGWSDRQRWELSSDLAYRAAHGYDSVTVPSGYTWHMDWQYGWDSVTFLAALRNCSGVDGVQGHECNSSVFSSTSYLIGGQTGEAGVAGRNPQVDFSDLPHVNETDAGWRLVAPAWSGSLTSMHMHSMNDNQPPAANDNPTRLAGAASVDFNLHAGGR